MKIDRHGKAKILTQSEIQLLFSQGLQSDRDSEALLRLRKHGAEQQSAEGCQLKASPKQYHHWTTVINGYDFLDLFPKG